MRDLDYIARQFEDQKQKIREINEKNKIEIEQYIDSNPYENLCKDLNIEVSHHKDVTSEVKKLQHIKSSLSESSVETRYARDFFFKVEEIIEKDYYDKEEESTELF